ncbi:MAG: ATP-binding protein [Janthinobacterium lividum]
MTDGQPVSFRDLSDEICAREPIHIPGAIQPHGVLLGADPVQAFAVVVMSANAASLLSVRPIGSELGALFGQDFVEDLHQHLKAGDLAASSPWETTVQAADGRILEAAIHLHDGLVLLELEAMRAEDAAQALASARLLQRWVGRLRSSTGGITSLARVVAQGIREISSYERVLVYRFDTDWNGQAIAEDKTMDWAQSFDGLHFPASDIPAQARELYRHSLMRWVPDRDYEPVPLLVASEWPQRLVDLSYARLRSLSPVHLSYHRNMGVDGTMSVSILRDGALWGLVVCHHRQPHRVSPGQRAAIAALVDAFALRVGPAEQEQTEAARSADSQRLVQLLAHMAQADDVITAVANGPVKIDALFDATGAAAVHAGTVVPIGRTPPAADLLALVDWLRANVEKEVFHTDHLAEEFPSFLPHAETASGLLAVFLSQDRSDLLLWFRPEVAQEVSWGGDPRKQIEGASAHPLPRQSFERWIEKRHGRARPWAAWELEMAGTLRHAIVEVIVRSLQRMAELNDRLRQSQKMEAVGQLTGGLAHDFNNLLTGITGSLELLQSRVAQGRLTNIDRYIIAAQGAAGRAAALTHRLLAFSRRQTLDPKPTDVNRLIVGMEELVRRTTGPEIEVETVLGIGLWPTLCDPNQLENALLNLCINARDAMPDGGRLTIETTNTWLDEPGARDRAIAPGQYVAISVTDTGTGMSPEVVARAFDPFFTTKPIGQGTGLGLSMIYGFARQSNGEVRIYSELGQGTTMRLYLPRNRNAAADEASTPDLADAPRAQHGETVLIVDDEPTIRMLVTEVLEELGYGMAEAADGAGGLRILQSNTQVDLLITDVGLPGGMNGRQLADAARQNRPGLKVLFITGYAENAAVGNGHLPPGMHVLTKPFAMETLATRVKSILSGE